MGVHRQLHAAIGALVVATRLLGTMWHKDAIKISETLHALQALTRTLASQPDHPTITVTTVYLTDPV